jgi:hypothetical protein
MPLCQHIDAAPFADHSVYQALQVFNRLVATGNADAAKLRRQGLALAR